MTLSRFFKKLFSPIVVGNCLGVVVATCLLCFAGFYFLQCYTDHGNNVTVPNVRGQRFDIAQKKLRAVGLLCEVSDTGYVDTYIGDVVLEQSIAPGEQVKAGRVVELTINASSARAIALPPIADNCSRREAEAKLRALGFRSLRIELTPGDKDWVFNVKANGQPAHTGQRISVTTVITLVIGDGKVNEEFNGNDSLDYEYFRPEEEEEEIIEDGGGVEAPTNEESYDE